MGVASRGREKIEVVGAVRSDGDEACLEERGQLAAALPCAVEGMAGASEVGAGAPVYDHICLALNQSTQREQTKSHGLHRVGFLFFLFSVRGLILQKE